MQKQSISAFIDKTWTMLETNSFSYIVRWAEDGNSFRILDEAAFENEVLPIYFKHSNLTSFQRQVNITLFSSICIISTRKKLNSATPNTTTDCSREIRGNPSIIQRTSQSHQKKAIWGLNWNRGRTAEKTCLGQRRNSPTWSASSYLTSK